MSKLGIVYEKRTVLLTWYKKKIPKDIRTKNGFKFKYGVQLGLVNHGEKIEFLENNEKRISTYNQGQFIKSKLIDEEGHSTEEIKENPIQEDGSIKLTCTHDALYVGIIAEYGMPKRVKNKRPY